MKKITYKQLKEDAETIARLLHKKKDPVHQALNAIKNKPAIKKTVRLAGSSFKNSVVAMRIAWLHTQNQYFEWKLKKKNDKK